MANSGKTGSSSFCVDLMYTGIKSTPSDGRRQERPGANRSTRSPSIVSTLLAAGSADRGLSGGAASNSGP